MAESFLDQLEQTIESKKATDESFQESLDSTLDEFGFADEAKIKAAALFYEAVENKESRLRAGLKALLCQYGPILGEDVFDVIDEFSNHIQQLESSIVYYEGANRRLAAELKEHLSERYQLDGNVVQSLWNTSSDFTDLENNLYKATRAERTPKKSFVEEDLEQLNDDTTFAKGEEYVSPQMAPYLRFFR